MLYVYLRINQNIKNMIKMTSKSNSKEFETNFLVPKILNRDELLTIKGNGTGQGSWQER